MDTLPDPIVITADDPGPEFVSIGHGFHARLSRSRFGTALPSPDSVAVGVAAITGETVVPQPATAANAIGLTAQMPMRAVYLTSGDARTFHIGAQTLELRQAEAWKLAWPDELAGVALRALIWAGPNGIDAVLPQVIDRLPPDTRSRLVAPDPERPAWLAHRLARLAGGNRACTATTSRG